MNTSVEYSIELQPLGGWRVLRDGLPMAVRTHVLDAVSLATRFAERETARGQDASVVYNALGQATRLY